jgi:hypothetical protein
MIIDALDSVRDREKAGRILDYCLKKTNTVHLDSMSLLLDTFVARLNGNEDIIEAALRTCRPPHETMVLAVTLMRESLPVDSQLRTIADEASAKSKLADDYFCLYVGQYVAPKESLSSGTD